MTDIYEYGNIARSLSRGVGVTWTEAQARKAHDKGKMYAVIVRRDGKPYCYVMVVNITNAVEVGFYDDYMRAELVYVFSRRDKEYNNVTSGDLFLGQVALRKRRPPPSDEVVFADLSYFKPNGEVRIEKTDLTTTPRTTETARFTADLSGLWEPWPEFGSYESIIRRERPIGGTVR